MYAGAFTLLRTSVPRTAVDDLGHEPSFAFVQARRVDPGMLLKHDTTLITNQSDTQSASSAHSAPLFLAKMSP